MALRDSLGSTLSDEESEAVVQSPEIPSGITAPPAAADFGDPTYKFTFRSPQKMPDNDKNTNGNSNSSSDDDFEHVNTDEMIGEAQEVGTNSVPSTPTKVTPHKRTAHAAHGTPIAASSGTGSPPRSPVPKKKKWEDFVKEDDEKQKRDKSQSPSPASPESAESLKLERSLKMKKGIALSVIVCALAIGWMLYQPQSELVKSKKPQYSWKKADGSFFNKTKAMGIEFPKQNRETWIQIYAAISSTMEKTESVHPAVITVLLPPKMNMNFASCFLRKVGNAVNEAVAPILNMVDGTPAAVVTINPSTITEDSITKFRSDIEEYFRNGKAVIIFDLEEFKSEFVLMQLYGLCDNYLAIEKRATVLIPVRVPQEIFQKFEWLHGMGGEISNAVLSEMWKTKLVQDTIPAMIVRITDSVILLNEGDECSL